MHPSLNLSLVIPVFNEKDNLVRLLDEITIALAGRELAYEVIFVDDGSSDGSAAVLGQLAHADERVIVIRFRRNFGQTAAFAAGFDYARGAVVVTMDADLQNDPADIPRLLQELDGGVDVVNGWRQQRQDSWLRRFPSRVANRLIARSTGVQLHDRGCSLRAMRHEVAKDLRLYGEMHRFIPELINGAGFTMSEVPVSHRPRVAGRSKYGLSRTFRVILDLITILFLRRYGNRPMHLFGSIGILSGGLGILTLAYLLGIKLWAGLTRGMIGFNETTIGDRPLLMLGVLLTIIGVQFLTMGLLAELQVRTYYESQRKPTYYVREVISAETPPDSP